MEKVKRRPPTYERNSVTQKQICPVPLCGIELTRNMSRHCKDKHSEWWAINGGKRSTNGTKKKKNKSGSSQVQNTKCDSSDDSSNGLTNDHGDNTEEEVEDSNDQGTEAILEFSEVEGMDLGSQSFILPATTMFQPVGILDRMNYNAPPTVVHLWNPYPKEYVNTFQSTPAPVYSVTRQEMETYGPAKFVDKILEKQNSFHKSSGLIVVRPVKTEYKARLAGYSDVFESDLNVTPKILDASHGDAEYAYYLRMNDSMRNLSLQEYREKSELWSPEPSPDVDKEALFWDEDRLLNRKVLYGSDVVNSTSLFDDNAIWHLDKVDSILKYAQNQMDGKRILGLTSSYTYFGCWGSAFNCHIEDMDTVSCNYLHYGAKKIWYSPKPDQLNKFKRMLNDGCRTEYDSQGCPAPWRHKIMFPSPNLMMKYGIEYVRAEQEEGDFVFALNGAFHFGYNEGFNIAEAVNLGTNRWLRESLAKKPLICHKDCYYYPECIWFSMEEFERERYAAEGPISSSDDGSDDEEYDPKKKIKKNRRGMTSLKVNKAKKYKK